MVDAAVDPDRVLGFVVDRRVSDEPAQKAVGTVDGPLAVDDGGGVLVNAASFASLIPSLGSGGYAASKAAVYSMTRSLAAELAPLNIRVIGYVPGVIETEMTAPTIKAKKEMLESQLALKRIGSCEDVANAVLFMASDKASYITGTFIEISGGKLCVQNPADAWP